MMSSSPSRIFCYLNTLKLSSVGTCRNGLVSLIMIYCRTIRLFKSFCWRLHALLCSSTHIVCYESFFPFWWIETNLRPKFLGWYVASLRYKHIWIKSLRILRMNASISIRRFDKRLLLQSCPMKECLRQKYLIELINLLKTLLNIKEMLLELCIQVISNILIL